MAESALHPMISDILEDGVERLLLQNRLLAIVAAYERAQADPKSRIPSYLEAAIEAAKLA